MSYLRADDGLDSHPKILALETDQRRWTWLRVLLYTTRYGSPEIPPNISETVPKATRTFLRLCQDIGLIETDPNTGTMRVHDWGDYNGVIAEKRERWKENKRTQRGQNGGQTSGQAEDTPKTGEGRESDSRAGDHARPHPLPQKDLKAEQFSVRPDAALPSAKDLEEHDDFPDRSDPVVRLLLVLRDRDERTEHVLRSFVTRVPEAAFDFTRDEIERTGGGAGKAVTILKRIEREGTLASPAEHFDDDSGEPPTVGVTQNGSGRGTAYVAGLIHNGVITERHELETELADAGVPPEDRAALVSLFERAQVIGVDP